MKQITKYIAKNWLLNDIEVTEGQCVICRKQGVLNHQGVCTEHFESVYIQKIYDNEMESRSEKY